MMTPPRTRLLFVLAATICVRGSRLHVMPPLVPRHMPSPGLPQNGARTFGSSLGARGADHLAVSQSLLPGGMVQETAQARPKRAAQAMAVAKADSGAKQPRRSAVCALLGLMAPACGAQKAKAVDKVRVYFGQGCFWHVQHELTVRSIRLAREAKGAFPEGSFSPAIAGYAGGRGRNPSGQVCYNAYEGKSYDDLGHAEVVALELPIDALGQMAKLYFDEASNTSVLPGGFMYSGSPEVVAGRHDPQDVGSAYRSVIGLPGGLTSEAGKMVQQANGGRMKLVPGKGGDPDTLGKGVVYVYDTSEFPFYPAELYHQFHDDMSERYSKGYRGIKGTLEKAGLLSKRAGCET